ncbi:MAG: hypothetical protein KIH67_002075 [Candidatus Moranbacteria bacterium]|nr:hypothetical protein [Candidatus Moranbacteria bacterium]
MNFENTFRAESVKLGSERESPVHRIVGGSPETQRRAQAYWKGVADGMMNRRKEDKNTQEIPPELHESIEKIHVLLVEFLREYGLEESIEITPEHTHFINKASEDELEKGILGTYRTYTGEIDILQDLEKGDYWQICRILVHEMIHMQSFQSVTAKKWSPDLKDKRVIGDLGDSDNTVFQERRMGISMMDKSGSQKELLLRWANEAVTEELSKRFMHRYAQKIPIIKEKAKAIKKRRRLNHLKRFDLERAIIDPMMLDVYSDEFNYKNYRENFNILVSALYRKDSERNTPKYKTREDVFKLFSGAMLNGRLLPIARALESLWASNSKQEGMRSYLRAISK